MEKSGMTGSRRLFPQNQDRPDTIFAEGAGVISVEAAHLLCCEGLGDGEAAPGCMWSAEKTVSLAASNGRLVAA
jgi:hypothetical protein